MYLCIVKANRNVAQLVAHYVRDVGVGRSSRLIPTAAEAEYNKASAFLCNNSARPHVRCGELKQGLRTECGRSSRLIPTAAEAEYNKASAFFMQ